MKKGKAAATMMTKKTDARQQQSDVKDLESRIALGDRDAMATYLALALRSDIPVTERQRRYSVVSGADHGNDSMVLRNLGIVAASVGQLEKSHAFAQDFVNEGFFSDAFHVSLALKEFGEVHECYLGEEVLSALSQAGYIHAQILRGSVIAARRGLLFKAFFQVFRLVKMFQLAVLAIKNPNDPRILP